MQTTKKLINEDKSKKRVWAQVLLTELTEYVSSRDELVCFIETEEAKEKAASGGSEGGKAGSGDGDGGRGSGGGGRGGGRGGRGSGGSGRGGGGRKRRSSRLSKPPGVHA